MCQCEATYSIVYSILSLVLFLLTLNSFLITNKGNPFNKEAPNDKDYYFNISGNENLTNENLDIYYEEIVNEFFSIGQKFSKSYVSTNQPPFLRLLMEENKCNEIQNNIIINNKTLIELFNLNIDSINIFLFGLTISIGLSFILSSFNTFVDIGMYCCSEKMEHIERFKLLVNFIDLAFGIINLVFFILFIIKHNKSQINEYCDFLDTCKVNKKAFEKFQDIKNFNIYITIIIHLNISYLILNILKIFFKKKKNEKDNDIDETFLNLNNI